MDQADGVIIPKSVNYSQESGTTAPLYFVNESPHAYVFKIRTNQKTALSLHSSHGFLRPHSQLQVPIKIIQKPSSAIPLKLEVNYALATQQEIDANDSKRAIIGKTELTKLVISLREGKKNDVGLEKIIESSEKMVLNHSNEEYSALDSSVKKEQSQNGIDPSQNCPKRLMPKIRTPMKNRETDDVQHQMGSMFRHTFSIDKPPIEQNPLQSDQYVKMNVFTTAKQQNPSPPPSSRDEQFDPFSMLLQSVKNEYGMTIKSKFMENEKNDEKVNFQEVRQQQILQNKPQSLLKQSQQIKNSIIDIKIMQEEKEQMRALERELHELYVRIQCHEDFIKELKSIPQVLPVKRYPKILFMILSIVFFCLGGLIKHLVI